MGRLRSISLVLLVFLGLPVFLYAQVIFTEIMFNVLGSDYHDEYVELYNLSDSEVIDLTGWTFSDSTGLDFLTDAGFGMQLEPHQFGVILDESYFANSSKYDDVIPEGALILTIDNGSFGSSGLSNSIAEQLTLMDSLGNVVQTYKYSLDNDDGYSDEKIIFGAGNSGNNWLNSLVLGGTPGYRNSVTPFNYDLSVIEENTLEYHPSLMITSDQTIQFDISITNTGLQNFADSLQIHFYVDYNQDSLYQESDFTILAQETEIDIELHETYSFECNWAPDEAGMFSINLQIDSKGDMNTVNNFTTIELIVYESEETVAINEIKFLTQENEPEWIELYNYGTKKLNMYAWGIADSVDTCWIDSTLYLFPGQYKVFAETMNLTDFYELEDSLLVMIPKFPTLNNTSDILYLLNPGAGWVEQVPYETSWLEGEEWRVPSLERINPELDSRKAVNWGPCTQSLAATPAKENALFTPLDWDQNLKVSCAPNPFSPDGDGFEDVTIIHLISPSSSGKVRIKIFDVNGHEVRTIRDDVFVGSSYSAPWDGNNNQGRGCRMGIYIILAQILDDRNGLLKEYKTTVVLAARM